MEYETQLKCKKPKCEGVLTIPIRIVIKRDIAVILTRCYKCKTKYKAMFSTLDRDQWISLIRDLFLRCENCGLVNPNEWHIISAGFSVGSSFKLMHRTLRLANPCPNCAGNGPKDIDDWLWSFIKPQEAPLPKLTIPTSAPKIFCVNCGSPIAPGAQFCTNCGSKV